MSKWVYMIPLFVGLLDQEMLEDDASFDTDQEEEVIVKKCMQVSPILWYVALNLF